MLRLAAALGAVHRDIGIAQQAVGGVRARGAEGDADAGRDVELPASKIEGRQELLGDAVRHDTGPRLAMEALQQDNELVASQTRDRLVLPNAGAKAIRDLFQERVADMMAEAVVDLLEIVDIEKQQTDAGDVASGPRQRLIQPICKRTRLGRPVSAS